MSVQPTQLLRCRLRCDATAPQLIRHALRPLLELEPVHEDALMVASELVTNAVLHSGCESTDELEVVAELTPDALLITVTDPGLSGCAPRPRDDSVGSGGFGLRIVERIARRWGSEKRDGLRVWAELALTR